jgi:hypothetical protein
VKVQDPRPRLAVIPPLNPILQALSLAARNTPHPAPGGCSVRGLPGRSWRSPEGPASFDHGHKQSLRLRPFRRNAAVCFLQNAQREFAQLIIAKTKRRWNAPILLSSQIASRDSSFGALEGLVSIPGNTKCSLSPWRGTRVTARGARVSLFVIHDLILLTSLTFFHILRRSNVTER